MWLESVSTDKDTLVDKIVDVEIEVLKGGNAEASGKEQVLLSVDPGSGLIARLRTFCGGASLSASASISLSRFLPKLVRGRNSLTSRKVRVANEAIPAIAAIVGIESQGMFL